MADARREIGDGAWVEFKASGYPYKLKKQLREASDDEAVLQIILPYIVACSLPTVDGNVVASVSGTDDLVDVDETIVSQVIWKFYDFRGERLREPLTKNN